MESNMYSSTLLSENQTVSTYTCEKCHQIPKLRFEDNQVRITCPCEPKNTVTISFNEFSEKANKQNIKNCLAHPNAKGVNFCSDCGMWLCPGCSDSHRVIPLTKGHHLMGKEIKTLTVCETCQKEKSTKYCLECMKYSCEECSKKEHNEHYVKPLNAEENQKTLKEVNQRMNDFQDLNQKMTKFKDKLIEKINSDFQKYNETYMNFINFMNILNNGFALVGQDFLNFNVINNLEGNIPNLSGNELLDCENINDKSIKAFLELCERTTKVKDILIKELGVYEGEVRNNERNGPGKYFGLRGDDKGDIYEGNYFNDRRQGFSKMIYATGGIYEGEVKDGVREGKGKFKYKGGDIYEGNFVNGKREGYGKYIFKSGNWYDGYFKENNYDGFGILYNSSGNVIESGRYENDKLVQKCG